MVSPSFGWSVEVKVMVERGILRESRRGIPPQTIEKPVSEGNPESQLQGNPESLEGESRIPVYYQKPFSAFRGSPNPESLGESLGHT